MSTGESLAIQSRQMPERCPECGRPAIAAAACAACGFELAAYPAPPVSSAVEVRPRMPLAIPSPPAPAVRHPAPVAASSRIDVSGAFRRHSISGRVLLVMPPASEPMDPDPWKWLAVPSWGLILLSSPFVAGMMALQAAGLLAAAVVFLVLAFVLRFLFSSHLIWSWQTVAALRGRHLVEPMPVTMLRVRLGNDREVQLRMKGHTEGGAVGAGDRVEAIGTWRNGVLRVSELHCRRTGAVLRPKQPRALPWLLAAVGILLSLLLWLEASFIPWMHGTNLMIR